MRLCFQGEHGMHMHFVDLLLKPNLYLDPGSGSMLFQMLLAGIVGALFAVRIFWRKIKGIFVKTQPGDEAGETPDDEPRE
jgi:TRAP-type C4-dicarboxylate transport system permease small subunit